MKKKNDAPIAPACLRLWLCSSLTRPRDAGNPISAEANERIAQVITHVVHLASVWVWHALVGQCDLMRGRSVLRLGRATVQYTKK